RDYLLDVRFIPNRDEISKGPEKWFATIRFRCCDIAHVMREGLRWTSANRVPELEFYRTDWPKDSIYPTSREYTLREFPDKPKWQSRWVAEVTLASHSQQTLSTFQLDGLSRENVHAVTVWNREQRMIFSYVYNFPIEKIYGRYGTLPPHNDPWWFLP
ncbi:hypothetical protein QBC46DRAFT_227449, partial [Diplogelasinospora grovesii]